MIIPKLNELIGPQFTEKHFKIHYSEFYEYLINNYPQNISFQEKLYWYYNNLSRPHICPVCGSYTKFVNVKEGYREYCSSKCSNSDKKKLDKTKQTCLKKYGYDCPSKSELVKNKAKQTCLKKYGLENAMQNKDISNKSHNTIIEKYGGHGNASTEIFEKYKHSNLEKYGCENAMQNKDIKLKLKQTYLEKYGVEHPSKSIDIIKKIAKSRKLSTIEKYNDVISLTEDDNWLCCCPYPECNKCESKTYIVSPQIYRDRKRDGTIRCTKLLKIGHYCTKGTSIELFVQNILDLHNIKYNTNVRTLEFWNKKEVDIFIPSKNIAIECNGIQSHCSYQLGSKYHMIKYDKLKDMNIQLLTIWQDWIQNKPHIIESIILSKLGIYSERIGARQCKIKEIDSRTCNNFLNQNHIQGATQSKVHLGLYYKDDLVAVMTFGHKRAGQGNKEQNKDVWELSRFCSLLNTQIIGGAEKLISYFIKHYNPSTIYSFSCHDISNGNLYKKLGFKESGDNLAYWYIESRTFKRYHRSVFTKQSIIERGWKESKEGWKEADIMKEHGYFQIYDSGQTKWVKNI